MHRTATFSLLFTMATPSGRGLHGSDTDTDTAVACRLGGGDVETSRAVIGNGDPLTRRISHVVAVLGALLLAPASGTAEEAFTGATAALLDWAVKSCEVKGSDRLHTLVAQAKSKGEDAFSKQYMKGFGAKDLADANASDGNTKAFCTKLKEWYGRSGSRIAGLIDTPSEPRPEAQKRTQADTPSTGRRRRRQAQ